MIMGNQSLRYYKNLVFDKQSEGFLLQLIDLSVLGIETAEQLRIHEHGSSSFLATL